jgi:hypothetical protein
MQNILHERSLAVPTARWRIPLRCADRPCYPAGVTGFATISGFWAEAPVSQQIFLVIGIFGLVLIILQAAFGLVFGHHGEMNTDGSMDGHDGHGWAAYLSLRAISATLLGFGFGGAYLDRIGLALGIAMLGGLCLGLLIGAGYMALVGSLNRLHSVGSIFRLVDALSHTGTVYLPIPGESAGPGEIQVAFGGRSHNVAAFTEGPALPVGAFVRVVGLHGENALTVEKAEQLI